MRVFLTLSLALGTVAGGCEFDPDPVVLTLDPEAGAPRGGGAVFAPEDHGTPLSHHGARTSPPDGTADGTMEDPAAPDALPSADASSPGSPLVCCGDGVCVAGGEDCVGCRSDCGDCSLCGDGACGAGESHGR